MAWRSSSGGVSFSNLENRWHETCKALQMTPAPQHINAALTSRSCRGKSLPRQDLRGSVRNLRHFPLKRERSCTITEAHVRDLDNIVAEAQKKICHGQVAMADSMTVQVLKAGEHLVRVPPRIVQSKHALRRSPQMMQARVVMLEHDVDILLATRLRHEEAVQMEYIGVLRQSHVSLEFPDRFMGLLRLCLYCY